MPESSRGKDQRVLRRTQLTTAGMRVASAVAGATVIGVVLLNGEYNEDRYELPVVEWEIRLWQPLALAFVCLVSVVGGAVSDFSKAARRRR